MPRTSPAVSPCPKACRLVAPPTNIPAVNWIHMIPCHQRSPEHVARPCADGTRTSRHGLDRLFRARRNRGLLAVVIVLCSFVRYMPGCRGQEVHRAFCTDNVPAWYEGTNVCAHCSKADGTSIGSGAVHAQSRLDDCATHRARSGRHDAKEQKRQRADENRFSPKWQHRRRGR